jgi:hypothetical protein
MGDPRDCILGKHVTDDIILRRATSRNYQVEIVKATPAPRRFLSVRFEDFVLKQEEALCRLECFGDANGEDRSPTGVNRAVAAAGRQASEYLLSSSGDRDPRLRGRGKLEVVNLKAGFFLIRRGKTMER